MRIHTMQLEPDAWRQDIVLLFCHSNEPPLSGVTDDVHAALPWLADAPGLCDVKGKTGETLMLYGPAGMGCGRALLVGLGPKQAFDLTAFRTAVGAAARHCAKNSLSSIAVSAAHLARIAESMPAASADTAALFEEAAFGIQAALYRIDAYKGKKSGAALDEAERLQDENFKPEDLSFFFTELLPDAARIELENAVRRGDSCAAGLALARDVANGPANVVTPAYMADAARGLAARHGFNCRVYDRAECVDMGMGAFMSVAGGAGFEPCLIVLEHTPPGTENDKPLVFVGKGITFDTGGISLKPAAGLAAQKSDMSGAAAVLGAFDALGRENTPCRVVGILPCTENMPDAHATRPGDIVTAMSGTTIEIVNTDAEGRLILCDALTFAQRAYEAACLIDIATLTGACVVALGKDGAGLFSPEAELARRILDISEGRGENCWQMPLWKHYADGLKSDTADLANAGPREGGAILAALFLRHFIEPGTNWAHLDIAGPAFTDKPHALGPKGATGFGVRTLFELARTWHK